MALRTRVFGPEILTPDVMARFWPKVARTDHGCWEWIAARGPTGYGKFGIGASSVHQAHRISYVWATQEPIPSGLDVDHLCRNRACVRPDHLEAVDRATNIARSTSRGAPALAGKCQRGHDMTLPDAWCDGGKGVRRCRLCRNLLASERAKRREVMDAKNAKRRWLRANDPEYAELERERDRRRYREGRR